MKNNKILEKILRLEEMTLKMGYYAREISNRLEYEPDRLDQRTVDVHSGGRKVRKKHCPIIDIADKIGSDK